jgi:hypothetical protein
MVHDRHMSVYEKYSVLILVMATDVPSCLSCPILFPEAVVTGICLLILRCFFSCCTRLARLNAAHLLRPKGKLGQAQTILFSQLGLAPFPPPSSSPPPRCRGGGGFRGCLGRGPVFRGRGFHWRGGSRGHGGGRRRRVGGVGVELRVDFDCGVSVAATAAGEGGGGGGGTFTVGGGVGGDALELALELR